MNHNTSGATDSQTPRPGVSAAAGEEADVYRLLEQLENLPSRAKSVGKVMYNFDQDTFYYLVLKIRANLPEDMKRAKRVTQEKSRIVDEARETANSELETKRAEASHLMDLARRDAENLRQNTSAETARVLDNARAEAEHIVAAATQKSETLLRNTESHAARMEDDARRQAAAMIENSEVMRLATAQANEMIRRAETEATEIRKGAYDYSSHVLESMFSTLEAAALEVNNGRKYIESQLK